LYSHSVVSMSGSAVVISGKLVSAQVRESLKEEVAGMAVTPKLVIVQVGGREDSNVYIRMKSKAAEEIGMLCEHVKLSNEITQSELLEKIDGLNKDEGVHGIIVQMPLDAVNTIDSALVTDAVLPSKDVDGLHTVNAGKVARGQMSGFMPCTPAGCMELIRQAPVEVSGATAVVVGRSKIVGAPMRDMLTNHNATVTTCHSRTKDIGKVIATADILVVAIGKPHFVKAEWIKPGAVVIDCGINSIPDASKKSGQRLVGDVDYAAGCHVAGWITPVPGGVGPMTVAMLMKNTVIAAQKAGKL